MKLAIIGGSLLKQVSALTETAVETIDTPFGLPSGQVVSGHIDGLEVVYINRHGPGHHVAPHLVNYRANMFVLKLLEVTHVLGVMAVGGITPKMTPMRWVLPDQIIDYTYGREQTYNDGSEVVHHIDFSYPYDEPMRQLLAQALQACGHDYSLQATYGATQGPRLETAAEIRRMERDGCDIVGMTAMPEASLARELEMPYANLALVVNWAAGKPGTVAESEQAGLGLVSLEEIRQMIDDGNVMLQNIIPQFAGLLRG